MFFTIDLFLCCNVRSEICANSVYQEELIIRSEAGLLSCSAKIAKFFREAAAARAMMVPVFFMHEKKIFGCGMKKALGLEEIYSGSMIAFDANIIPGQIG